MSLLLDITDPVDTTRTGPHRFRTTEVPTGIRNQAITVMAIRLHPGVISRYSVPRMKFRHHRCITAWQPRRPLFIAADRHLTSFIVAAPVHNNHMHNSHGDAESPTLKNPDHMDCADIYFVPGCILR